MKHKHFKGMLVILLAFLMTLSVIPGFQNLAIAESDDSELQNKFEVTFSVIGSQLIYEEEDHDKAHETWLEEDVFVEPGTSLSDLTDTLLNRPDQGYYLVKEDGFVKSITVEGKGSNTYQLTNGIASSWMWYNKVGDQLEMGMTAPEDYELQAGDHLVWKFENDPEYPFELVQEYSEPALEIEKTPDHWTSFAKNNENNAVYKIDKLSLADKEILWQHRLGELDEWGSSHNSDFLIIGDHIFIANGETLYKLDKTGAIIDESSLRSSINYFARPAYDNGMVIVPLAGGALQAIRASDMETLWLAEAMKYLDWDPETFEPLYYDLENLSSLYIKDGFVYSASSAFSDFDPFGGIVRSVDMTTGRTQWIQDISGGFYWSGPVEILDHLLIAGEDGILRALDTKTGDELAQLDIGSKVRSTLVKVDDYIFFTDIEGNLNKVKFDTENTLFSEHEKINFSEKSTSTPSILAGKAYVGGDNIFAIIDIDSMTVNQTFDLNGSVQSTPLVLQGNEDELNVYFTLNNENGLLYVYDGQVVEVAYEPGEDAKNYTVASPIVDQDGNIYYTNDSGYIFTLADIAEEVVETETELTSKPSEQALIEGEDPDTGTADSQDKGIPAVIIYSSLAFVLLVVIILWLRKRKKVN